MRTSLQLKQIDRADVALKFASDLGIRQIARLDCGCWRVMFATGTYREHNCGRRECWGKRILAVRRWQKDWPRDCECGELRKPDGLVERSAKAARSGDLHLRDRLRAERWVHWLECGDRKERT
jgi:hypothetical protein